MAYKPKPAADGSARSVVPCVRLGAMMEGAYPEKPSGVPRVDADFATRLEATIKAFQEEVWVLLVVGAEKLADLPSLAQCCQYQYNIEGKLHQTTKLFGIAM